MKQLDPSKVTADQFAAYRRVQHSGKFNMITQALDAAYEARITLLTYLTIIENFDLLLAKFEGGKEAR